MALAVIGGLSCAAGDALAYTVYVSNEKGNSITVIDSDTLEVKETIRVGQRPRGIMLTKDGKSLLICASDDDTVQVLDVATNKIVGDLPSGPDPEQLNIHPSGNPVYIANEDDNLSHGDRSRDAQGAGRGAGRRRAGGRRHQPGRQER